MNRAKHPRTKTVLIVSDYPILTEIENDTPYSAASNLQLLSDLHKVGIKQLDVHATYLSYSRPELDFKPMFCKHKDIDVSTNWIKLEHEKDLYVKIEFWQNFLELLEEIKKVSPKLIIITGKWSLFFLTGIIKYNSTQGNFKQPKPLGGIRDYRASIMQIWPLYDIKNCIVMPILPPVTKQREPSKIPVMNLDYKKLGYIYNSIKTDENLENWLNPNRKTVIGTSIELIRAWFKLITEFLNSGLKVSVDIETRHGTIDCIGFSFSTERAFVIPFSTLDNPNPWDFETELEITLLMEQVLTHENIRLVGQNFSYDSQYLNKFYLIDLKPTLDTMITNHVLYNYMDKNLNFLASIYVDTYQHWKNMQSFSDVK